MTFAAISAYMLGVWHSLFTLDGFCQAVIVAQGCLTPYLRGKVSYKCVMSAFGIGLLSQPFWFYTTYVHDQWGMCMATIWYTVCNARGMYNYHRAFKDGRIKEG